MMGEDLADSYLSQKEKAYKTDSYGAIREAIPYYKYCVFFDTSEKTANVVDSTPIQFGDLMSAAKYARAFCSSYNMVIKKLKFY